VQDTTLFDTILGLQAPWHISRVALDTTGKRVDLWVEHAGHVRWACPECAAEPWRWTCGSRTSGRRGDGRPDGERKIVFDRFHIMREMTKAVDTVRKQEHRTFLRAGEDSPLTGTKYLWLFSDERRPDRHADSFATLQALNLTVGRAWAIKEALRTLWTYRQGAAVGRVFSQWYGWAVRSRLEPVKKVAGMLTRHLDGVLRFAKHPITNGVAEGLNSKIMSIKRKAGGFRNPSNFTTAIYFHCGGLDLYPRRSRKDHFNTC
jgi:transposase